MPEVAGDAAYFVDPTSPEGIAKGIETVYYDNKLKERLIEKGIDRTSLFSWKQSAELLQQTYISILENKKITTITPFNISIPKVEKNPL
jgi:glycosyltransferase involved in cell wall biosynthesis